MFQPRNTLGQFETAETSGPSQRQTERPEGPGVVKVTSNRFQSIYIEAWVDTNAHRGAEALADLLSRITGAERATLLSVEVAGVELPVAQAA